MDKILKNKKFRYAAIGIVLLVLFFFFVKKRKQGNIVADGKQDDGRRKSPAASSFDFLNAKELPSPRTPAEAAFYAEYKEAVGKEGIEPPATDAEVAAFKKWQQAVFAQQKEMDELGGKTTIEAIKQVARAKLELKRLQGIRKGKLNQKGNPIDENGVELV